MYHAHGSGIPLERLAEHVAHGVSGLRWAVDAERLRDGALLEHYVPRWIGGTIEPALVGEQIGEPNILMARICESAKGRDEEQPIVVDAADGEVEHGAVQPGRAEAVFRVELPHGGGGDRLTTLAVRSIADSGSGVPESVGDCGSTR